MSPSVELRRLIWVGPLTVAASIAAVQCVRFIAVALLQPDPAFKALTLVPPVVDTAVLVTLAVLVFRRVVLLSVDPIRQYNAVAIRALLFSFVPVLALAISHRQGATWPYAFALMAMHVAAWAVCVPMLTKLMTIATQPELPRDGDPGGRDIHAATIYKERLNERRQSLQQLLRWCRLTGYTRGAAGLSVPAILWLAFVLHLVSWWVAFLPAAVFLILHKAYEDAYRKLKRTNRAIRFYEAGLARIEERWMGTGITDTTFADADHLYANDLDLFGEGSLFELLCTARTRSGRETLAKWLCNPASRSEILRRQDAILELRDNVDLREELATFGPDRQAIDFDFMAEWALRPSVLRSMVPRIVAPFLVAFTLGSIAASYWLNADPSLLAVAIVAQIGFALLYRKRAAEVISGIHGPADELRLLEIPLARLEVEPLSSPKLCELKAVLEADRESASQRIGSLLGLVALVEYRHNPMVGPFLPVLLWSTQLAFAAEAWRQRHSAPLRQWMSVAGEFEALCALAGYAFEHPDYPFPEILEDETRFEGTDLRHPLLSQSHCVPNSIDLGHELRLLIVSGSNMSGKSTLLRTIGVNLVLAQAGAPVCAVELKCSLFTIGATLRMQDSLQGGKSRFYAEIRRLKEIMSLAEKGLPILFLLDEILHGTNSHDRAIGAEAVVRALVEHNAIGLVTTHDLALARLADALVSRAANVHFEDHLQNGEMVFDYRLRSGTIEKSNALELMRAVGLRV